MNMMLVDQKINDNVEVKVEAVDAKIKASVEFAYLIVAGPMLDKIAELIPGHFEDALIASAKAKLVELAAAK